MDKLEDRIEDLETQFHISRLITDDDIRQVYSTDPLVFRHRLVELFNETKKVRKFGRVRIDNNEIEGLRIYSSKKKKCGSSGCVHFGKYRNKRIVMKTYKGTNEKKIKEEVFFESLINIILHRYTNGLKLFSVPEVYAAGMYQNNPVIVQEQINGEMLPLLNQSTLQKALINLCKGLDFIQSKNVFMHRDLHIGNVLYDTRDEKVYILDFGHAFFSLYHDNWGIEVKSSWIGKQSKQCENGGKKYVCENNSHDICYLLLSLYDTIKNIYGTEYKWLTTICKDICDAYKEKTSEPEMVVANPVKNWNTDVFYYAYLLSMFDIELKDFTPYDIIKRLETLHKLKM